jgi:hypothetical protein
VAKADPINFAALVGQTVSLTVEPYSSGQNNGQYYVGLTEGIINGQSFYMYCVDPLHLISVPTTYSVMVEGLTSTTFTGDHIGLSLSQLQEQATVGLNFGNKPGKLQVDIDAQDLIWDIANPGMYSQDLGMLAMMSVMQATYGGRNYSGSFFLNPVAGGQAFDPVATCFTPPVPPPPVPEPSSLTLLGSGLLGLGLLLRWRQKHQLQPVSYN